MSNMEKNRSKVTVSILSHCWSVKTMRSKKSTDLQYFFIRNLQEKKNLEKTSLSFFVTVFKLPRLDSLVFTTKTPEVPGR